MEKMTKVALVGRPNVGKSALFNSICKKKIAIVDDAEGVTRDRLYAQTDVFGRAIEIIDTGGIAPRSGLPFQEEVARQTEVAILEADSLIMVVDGTVGVTSLDEHVAHLLLRQNKPVALAVNKIDAFSRLDLVHQFYGLGISRIVAVSAEQGFHIAELLEEALKGVPPKGGGGERRGIKTAIIGRPNVGKSTLVNYLLQEERCVVSEIAGTTRDSVDIDFMVGDDLFTLIDTAGIRRKRAEHEAVDKFAAIRTERAIERADICVLMLDAQEGFTTQEKRMMQQIEQLGKGCIILFNKWDLIKGFRMEHCLKALQFDASFVSHCPTLFVSAHTGRNLEGLFGHLLDVHQQLNQRVSTGQLNTFIEKSLQKYHPPMVQGRRLRIYYMAQVNTSPPHFVMFVNHPELMVDSYQKYLVNQFRETYRFTGAPLHFSLRGKRDVVIDS
jgi:GTPase